MKRSKYKFIYFTSFSIFIYLFLIYSLCTLCNWKWYAYIFMATKWRVNQKNNNKIMITYLHSDSFFKIWKRQAFTGDFKSHYTNLLVETNNLISTSDDNYLLLLRNKLARKASANRFKKHNQTYLYSYVCFIYDLFTRFSVILLSY